MSILHGLLHRENKWLIGVYKGRLITVSNWEKRHIWKYMEEIRSTGFFETAPAREKLVPYFLPLHPASSVSLEYGDATILKKYGLKNTAYSYWGPAPIPAQGHAEKGGFVLSRKIVREYEQRHGVYLKTVIASRPCVLALKLKDYYVRTGTFFLPDLESGKIVFTPCEHEKKYLVGKGILTNISPPNVHIDKEYGSMDEAEASKEEVCPVSKLGVSFLGRGCINYIVYRQVSTDLRTDMPLAMLKISRITNAFENMFRRLGERIRWEMCEKLIGLDSRNIMLDGTVVDYADLKSIDITDPKNRGELDLVNKELFSVMFSAALISVAHKDALLKMREGKKGLAKLIKKSEKEIFEKYAYFFKCFEEGLGEKKIRDNEIKEYFKEIAGKEGLQKFLDKMLDKPEN